MRRAAHGYMLFLHRLQQSRLSLGRRSVDFVRQNNLGEDRASKKLRLVADASFFLNFLEHVCTRDVSRKQIRCELDPTKRKIERVSEARNEQRLGQTGDTHEKSVSTCEHGDEKFVNNSLLPNYNSANLSPESVDRLAQLL